MTIGAGTRTVGIGKDTPVLSLFKVYADLKRHIGSAEANALERMARRATFEGDVVAGQRYVLANAGRNPSLAPAAKDIRLIKERFSNDIIETFGIAPDALTANEARYCVGFRSADEIRDCLTKARQEKDRRLRAQGVSRPGGATESLQAAPQLSVAALNLPPSST